MDSPDLNIGSQTSNFSDASDIEVQREIKKFEAARKAEKLDVIRKVLEGINIHFPANLNVLLDKNVSIEVCGLWYFKSK